MRRDLTSRLIRSGAVAACLVATAWLVVPAGAVIAGMSALRPPLPANSLGVPQAELNSVDCLSATWCTAVGHYQSISGSESLIILKNSVWGAPRPGPLPVDAAAQSNAVLNSVDCVSIDNCVTVGQYDSTTGPAGFIDTEKAGVWDSPRRTPLPANAIAANGSTLESVSCITLTTCVAVGQYANAAGNAPLIAWESAGKWNRAMASPMPASAKVKFTNQLSGVSCTSWGNCVAVGQFTNVSPAQKALIVTENNGVWGVPFAPHLPIDTARDPWSWLFGIDCVAKGYCTAVGVYASPPVGSSSTSGEGLIVTEVNGIWGYGLRSPEPPGYLLRGHEVQLMAVSCTSVGNCVASGQLTVGADQRGVVIEQVHGGWGNATIAPHPGDFAKPLYETLAGISCRGVHCSMVGQYQATLGQPAEVVTK